MQDIISREELEAKVLIILKEGIDTGVIRIDDITPLTTLVKIVVDIILFREDSNGIVAINAEGVYSSIRCLLGMDEL